jgi:hypothetical protein
MSCAAVWGFDDASLAVEGGAPVMADAATRDAARNDAASDDAATNDATAYDTRGTDAVAMEASTPPPHDAGVDQSAPPPTCSPPCIPGASCERAVGSASVCVSTTQTCMDSTDCVLQGCCVWLNYDSGVGRCESMPGLGTGFSCLCTTKMQGPPSQSCKKCEAPAGAPGASVMTCGP